MTGVTAWDLPMIAHNRIYDLLFVESKLLPPANRRERKSKESVYPLFAAPTTPRSGYRSPTPEEIALLAWLNERALPLDRERNSFWTRLRRLFLG
jgi:hypothetical protein